MMAPEDNRDLLEEFDRLYTLVEVKIREAEERVRREERERAAKVAEGMEPDNCCGDIAAAIRSLPDRGK